jgi:hypothetical protein
MARARWLAVVATAGSLWWCPVDAGAEVPWRGGFEPGDLSEWNEFTGPVDERVTIVRDPVRDGMYAARVEIQPGDLGNGGLNRVEMGYHPPGGWTEGTERYYAWSLMIPDDAPIGDGWHLLTYFEAEVLYTAAMSFRLYGDGMRSFCTFVGGEEVHWSAPFEQGQWHDFVLHVVWSPDPATGVVELWFDDALVLPATNVATMHTDGAGAAMPNFLHQGVLRWEGIADTEVLFVDGTMEATTLEDVMPEPGATTTGAGESSGGGVDTSGADTVADTTSVADDGATLDAGDGGGGPTTSSDDAMADGGPTGSGESTSGAASGGGDGCSCESNLPTRWPGLLLVWLLTRVRRRRPDAAAT